MSSRRRRHPHPFDLAAWFDGEGEPETGDHLAACRRCQRLTADLRRIRAAIRGEPVPSFLAGGTAWSRPRIASAAAALVLLLVAAVAWEPINQPISEAGRYLTGQQEDPPAPPTTLTSASRPPSYVAPAPVAPAETRPAAPPEVPPPTPGRSTPELVTAAGDPGSRSAPGTPATSPPRAGVLSRPAASPDPAPAAPPPTAIPVRVGSFVPLTGFEAGEGHMVAEAMRRAVAGVNRHGGVSGRMVELVVVDAADPAAVDRLRQSVDVMVGGYGAPAPSGLPWVLPADPLQDGPSVVSGELTPRQAGSVLAANLAQKGFEGTVGAVMGRGPDAALADGIAGALPVLRAVAGRDTSCDAELFSLRKRGVRALAFAGPPDLAARCADAAARMAWRPRGGILLAPDAAYAHLEDRLTVSGARTVLGLPWPTDDRPGTARYRSDVPGPPSYRSLVSYAAVELAAQIVREHGTVSPDRVRAARWSSDLYDLGAGRADPEVVTAQLGRWTRGRDDNRRGHHADEW